MPWFKHKIMYFQFQNFLYNQYILAAKIAACKLWALNAYWHTQKQIFHHVCACWNQILDITGNIREINFLA